MIYFDTSYLIRLYYQDAGADAVRALAATDHVACAAHGQAEMIAAFHRKLHEGAIRHVYQKLPASVFLRAADAIDLATAAESGFLIVYSNDAHLLAAAQHFGIRGKNITGQTP